MLFSNDKNTKIQKPKAKHTRQKTEDDAKCDVFTKFTPVPETECELEDDRSQYRYDVQIPR